MKRVISLLLSSVLALGAKAQLIEFTPYKSEAKVIVHFVEHEYQADVKIWEGPKYAARQMAGIWNYDNIDPYRIKVYVTKYKHEADILIYVVDDKWKVSINEDYIGLFYEERD